MNQILTIPQSVQKFGALLAIVSMLASSLPVDVFTAMAEEANEPVVNTPAPEVEATPAVVEEVEIPEEVVEGEEEVVESGSESEVEIDVATSSEEAPAEEKKDIVSTVTEKVSEIIKGVVDLFTGDKEVVLEFGDDGIATIETVELGVTYVAPQNSQVKVTFTSLPEIAGSLSIEEVTLTDEQVATLGALSNLAYDITSSMENGSFTYDLQLPSPEGAEESSKVLYAESLASLEAEIVNEVASDKVEVSNDVVSVSELDHFTIFVVVPNDIVNRPNIFSTIQGWSVVSTGNANIGLASISDNGVSDDFGSHVIKLSRAGNTSGPNRAFLGYFENNLKLKDIQEVKWNTYSKVGTDTYLNIYLRGGFLGLETASVVFVPGTTVGSWKENSLANAASIQVRHGSNPTYSSFSDLINSQYGNWTLRVDNDAKAGIVVVSGSTGNGGPQEHYVDGVTLKIKGTEKNFNFVELYEQENGDSQFISTLNYVQKDAQHASHMLAGSVRVPADTQEVRFNFKGVGIADVDGILGYEHIQSGQWPRANGDKNFRVNANLPEGEYNTEAEYLLNGNWFAIPGTAKVYSLSNPNLEIQYPNDSKYIFRSTDSNIVRVKISDKFESFNRAEFKINGNTFEVKRDNPGVDLRQAGNYVLVDITKALNWVPLPEGSYTATVNSWNKANGRSNNSHVPTRQFIIDTTEPVVTNFVSPNISSSSVRVSADVIDNNDVDSVTFYLSERDSAGVCKNNLPAIRTISGVKNGATNTYEASIDSTGLNGDYCVLVSAKDVATHNSTPLFKEIVIDNNSPVIQNISIDRTPTNESQIIVTGTVTDDNLKDYNLRVYKFDKSGQVSPWIGYTGTSSVNDGSLATLNVSSLTDGQYWVRIWADDLLGRRTGISSHIYVPFTIDRTNPTVTIKPESVGNGVDLFKSVSFKLYDNYFIDKVVINGVTKDLTNNDWSDVNDVKPGVFGAVEGLNTMVVHDVAGNTTTVEFTLDASAPAVPTGLGWKNASNADVLSGGTTNDYSGVAYWNQNSESDFNQYVYKYWNNIPSSPYNDEASSWKANLSGVANTSAAGVFNQGEGTHYFCVSAIDLVGNESACSQVFEITYTVPVVIVPTPTASSTTVEVKGNTSAGENQLGWLFGRDTGTQTPFGFVLGTSSIGSGSLFVNPITNSSANGNKDKFVGELFLSTLMSEIDSISYDFNVASNNANDGRHFYMNVYANYGTSASNYYYDCRYDVTVASGVVGGWTTVTFNPSQSYTVATRSGSAACPSSPDAMGAGAFVRAIAINVGDTSNEDAGVSGYLDNVKVVQTSGSHTQTTIYDFEGVPIVVASTPTPTTQTTSRTFGGRAASFGGTPQGQVLGASTFATDGDYCIDPYITGNLGLGRSNNSDQVTRLQNFLNRFVGTSLPVTGFFGPLTREAVMTFQRTYAADILTPWGLTNPTGFVYHTTIKKINEVICDNQTEFPLTQAQLDEIAGRKANTAQSIPSASATVSGTVAGVSTNSNEELTTGVDESKSTTDESTDSAPVKKNIFQRIWGSIFGN